MFQCSRNVRGFKYIWSEIKKHQNIIISTHIDADGDCIASATLLKEMIMANLENKNVYITGEKSPRYLSFIDETNNKVDVDFGKSLLISVDTSSQARIADQRIKTENTLRIDHHKTTELWKYSVEDSTAPATGQILFYMAKSLRLKLTDRAKIAIFVSIWTDTEGLTQRNVSKRTLKALKVININQSDIISKMKLNVEEVKAINKFKKQIKVEGNLTYLLSEEEASNDYIRQMVGIFSNEMKTGVWVSIVKYKGIFRGELRSNDGLDVSKIAIALGGGGHKASSGFKINTFEEVQKAIAFIKNEVNK